MKKILSVIIPSYNMENYISYCLDSLIVAENFDALEVLVVNDGSKDRTSDIAHGYALKYPNVFRVVDKENGNYGSCINRGLREATGKYVKVLDADDSFDTENFNEFIKFLQSHEADLILSDFAVVDTQRITHKEIMYRSPFNGECSINDICTTHVFKNMQMHAVTYRLSLLTSLNYRQKEGISFTDQEWIFIPMINVETVLFFKKTVYRYQIGRAGQTVSKEYRSKNFSHIRLLTLHMAESYEERKQSIPPNIRLYLLARVVPLIKQVYVFAITDLSQNRLPELAVYDQNLKTISAELYDYIGSKQVSSFMGIRYIDYWRKHRKMNRRVLGLLGRLYVGYTRLRAVGHEDEMSVPTSL